MNIKIQKAHSDQKPLLRNLAQMYCHDLSEYTGEEIEENGLFAFTDLVSDEYWADECNHHLLIIVDGNIAGFAIVQRTERQDAPPRNIIAYFFILRKYRRKGIGTEAVNHLFKMYPGKWGIGYVVDNTPAKHFWNKIIAKS